MIKYGISCPHSLFLPFAPTRPLYTSTIQTDERFPCRGASGRIESGIFLESLDEDPEKSITRIVFLVTPSKSAGLQLSASLVLYESFSLRRWHKGLQWEPAKMTVIPARKETRLLNSIRLKTKRARGTLLRSERLNSLKTTLPVKACLEWTAESIGDRLRMDDVLDSTRTT